MGLLIDGVWRDQWYDTESTGGKFERPTTQFRGWVTPDGSPGPDGQTGFPAEPDRYHMYVSLACPWAHRSLIARKLKGLEDVLPISIVDYHMGEYGWQFSERPGTIPDTVNGARYLHEVYQKADPHYTGRVTVPTLWDKKTGTIVSNESADILRFLNTAFDQWGNPDVDLYPEGVREDIEAINALVYEPINNGVYKTGFATTQEAYETAFTTLFSTLDEIEARLSKSRYLVASAAPTEADWRLFTTLIRFDAVYHGHFKCNRQQIADFPNLFKYLLELYQWPGVAETVDFGHIKGHYYTSHPMINPTGIVPLGPDQNLSVPHGRERLAPAQAAPAIA